MNKLNIIVSAFLCIFMGLGCPVSNEEYGASEFLKEARTYYKINNYEAARLKIDSIRICYPGAYDQIKSGIILTDSIKRDQSQASVDSLNLQINVFKRDMYLSEQTDSKELLHKIDSIQTLKMPFIAKINEITEKELMRAARCQCQTALKQRYLYD